MVSNLKKHQREVAFYLIIFRSDNCVKNHFYSKLRKAIRKLNRIGQETQGEEYKEINNQTLYKILEAAESKFKLSTKV